MAADVLLAESAIRERLRTALRPHVDWLLREQKPDGRWDSGVPGEFARTPAIADFLVWYDERCESRPEVRAAVRRAGLLLVGPAQWEATGLFRAGNHHDDAHPFGVGRRTLLRAMDRRAARARRAALRRAGHVPHDPAGGRGGPRVWILRRG